ncbi:uncharacterized protein LOC111040715 isoform X1 [Myzus persicae]|uniref:uncharacterized protein LOC111040715 isoform X1 n=1 Tax=Myzus persicae TaxID=13164 RepID=UPI000B938DFD|nr:uncharacterized protein LOC111040715 isoform X1 [Myzus persicae]
MVVVDYSSHDRISRNDYDQNDDISQQLLPDQDAVNDLAIANFCPRLRQAISSLSRHTVGPLQQRVQLSDFQSSTLTSLPTDDLSSNVQLPRNDKFVLALPYLYEDNLPVSRNNFMVRWSIIAQCSRPDKAPEVILLEQDNSSMNSGYGETTLRRTQQRPQQLQRRQYQTNQIIQERYWQQYVASDAFYIQCLTKWDKINNNSSSILQYCLLADQLYECYVNFQLYKLKISLKSTPTMLHPPPHLVLAYTQYKQLTKLSKLNMAEVGNVTNDISVELFIDLENGINNYDDRRNQITSSATVRMRAIISLISSEQTASITTESTDCKDDTKILSQLASVTGIFLPTGNKNTTKPSDTNVALNKKFVVRILSSKLSRTTPQGAMMAMMLNAITDQCFDTTMMDYVTYVRRVQLAAVQAYNYDASNSQEDKPSSDVSDNNSIKLLLEALHEAFCDNSSNDNCLLDYQINNNETSTKKTTSYFRFLLIDDDIVTETTQLKYILTIEYNKKLYEKLQTSTDLENTNQSTVKESVPVVSLRSVYDDENSDNYLNIDVDDLIETDKNFVKYYSELANIIKIATINGMRKLRKDVLTPVLTRYNKKWAPTDPYFLASSSTPPPYPAIL